MAMTEVKIAIRTCDRDGKKLSPKRVAELDADADRDERGLFGSVAGKTTFPDLCKPCVRSVRALGQRIIKPKRKEWHEPKEE